MVAKVVSQGESFGNFNWLAIILVIVFVCGVFRYSVACQQNIYSFIFIELGGLNV